MAKTIALGGVATGIMKAMGAANVTGIISNNGLASIACATDASNGSNISAVAVLDVAPVKKTTMEEVR